MFKYYIFLLIPMVHQINDEKILLEEVLLHNEPVVDHGSSLFYDANITHVGSHFKTSHHDFDNLPNNSI